MGICYSYDPDFSEYNLSVTGHVVLISVHLIALAFEPIDVGINWEL